MLEFNPMGHVYTYDGKVVPSVTTILDILSDWQYVDREMLERAAEFGTHVHLACAMAVRETLDWDDLDPALEPFLRGFQKFLRDGKAIVLESESPVYHAGLQYAGTLDLVVEMNGSQAVVDIKTGVAPPKTVGAQCSAYAMARFGDAGKRMKRYCLCLTHGGYKLTPLKDPNDWNIFVSARNLHRFKYGE